MAAIKLHFIIYRRGNCRDLVIVIEGWGKIVTAVLHTMQWPGGDGSAVHDLFILLNLYAAHLSIR